jgi:hypothetical protein
MDDSKKYEEMFILILKCFMMLIIFGIILPDFIENVFFELIVRYKVHGNSTFVYAILNKNFLLIYRFIYLFNLFLTL